MNSFHIKQNFIECVICTKLIVKHLPTPEITKECKVCWKLHHIQIVHDNICCNIEHNKKKKKLNVYSKHTRISIFDTRMPDVYSVLKEFSVILFFYNFFFVFIYVPEATCWKEPMIIYIPRHFSFCLWDTTSITF